MKHTYPQILAPPNKFPLWIGRIYLCDSIGVCAGMLAAELIDAGLVCFCRELDQEVTSIHLEHAWEAAVTSIQLKMC